MFAKIKDIVNSGIYKADEVVSKIMNLLKGDLDAALHKPVEAYDATLHKGEEVKDSAKEKLDHAESWVGEKVETAGDKVKTAGQKLQGEL
jgi:hypothetical protein